MHAEDQTQKSCRPNSCSCICNDICGNRVDGREGTVAEWLPPRKQLETIRKLYARTQLMRNLGTDWCGPLR